MHPDDFPLPSTPAVEAALELSRAYCSAAIVNHSIRSWLWASAFAQLEGRSDHDAELLAVAALLHDVGLAPEYDNHRIAYEHAGGHVAWALTAGARWDPRRRDRAVDVIVRHNWPSVDPAQDVEGYLLETATALDISGSRPRDLPTGLLRETLARYPRLDLAREFGGAVQDQALRKPDTAAARLVAGDVVGKLARNPLETVAAD